MKQLFIEFPILAGLFTFADITGIDPGLGSLLQALGIVGVLVWHLWYSTTHVFPKLQAAAAKERADLSKSYDGIIERIINENAQVRLEMQQLVRTTTSDGRRAVHDIADKTAVAVSKATEAIEIMKRQ